jgi:UDPglucose 6-dehydrogenase
MRIAVVGTGYVGLPTSVGFAELGHNIVCIDKVPEKIAGLNAGRLTLFEDGLEDLFNRNRLNGRLLFTTDMASGVKGADFVIIAVGTPARPVTGEADMGYVYAAAAEIAPHLSGYTVIADKSTVPVGTGDKVAGIIKNKNPNADFDVISLPEFLREGFAVHDFFHPDRVVVGTDSVRARGRVEKLYSVFEKYPDILFVGRRSAELVKYASNAFLAMKIHYMNEIADFCERAGADTYDVARGMGLDSRIGAKFLSPGPGYGGSCLPKDTNALAYMAASAGMRLSLVEAAISGNEGRKSKMAERILNAARDIGRPKVAVWGLAFKGGTDDVRESPAIQIVRELVFRGADVMAYDPKAMDTARTVLDGTVSYADTAAEASKGADVLAILTEWTDFARVPLEDLKMRRKYIVDLRHAVDPDNARRNGFVYEGLGRK